MKKCAVFIVTIILIGSTNIFSQQIDTLIQNIITQTNLDSLTHFINLLSGGEECVLPDTSFTISSRHYAHPDNEMAARYIKYQLECFGLMVFEQSYSSTGKNIYAVQHGIAFPDKQYIICAHYDDMPPSPPAPGTDDGASGVAAILETARILSAFNSDYTIIYAAWDEEEIGLIGSAYYAGLAHNNSDNILGVINLEMFGWDGDNDGKIDIHTDAISNSPQLAETLVYVNVTYNLGLNTVIYNPGTGASDHSSFWNYGFGAVVFSETFYGNDYKPFYHTSSDKIEHFNQNYFHKLSKLAVGTLALLALKSTIVNIEIKPVNELNFYLSQNYPNPFNPNTTIRFTIANLTSGGNGLQFTSLKVFDILGREVATLVEEKLPAGTYAVEFSIGKLINKDLPSGFYFYQLRMADFIQTKKMLVLK